MNMQTIARVILGLIFFVFGLNGFLNFIPVPPLPEAAGAFMGALVQSGYLMVLVKGIETFAGILLLANVYIPLALTLLAPIVVNIVLFHVFLAPAPEALAVPILAAVLEVFLILQFWDHFKGLLAK